VAGVRSVILVEGPGSAGSRQVRANTWNPASDLHTDGAQYYKHTLNPAKHLSVNHSAKIRPPMADGSSVHVNTLEGFCLSVFKRGIELGTYQHVESPAFEPLRSQNLIFAKTLVSALV